MASVVLDRVSKVFRHGEQRICALRDLQLEVRGGELLTIVGPSGSGKTTFLRLIAGLDAPSEGEIRIAGKSMAGVPPHERDVAMVFQSGALFPHLNVHDNIALGLKLRKVAPEEREDRIKNAIATLRVETCLSRLPADLSTGQRQRVALARAMVRRPGIFLLDEPLANLDAPLRAELRLEIVRLRSQLNATMIYVTHDQAEALSLGDRVAVFREGHLEQIDEPAVLYRRPSNMFVAGFMGPAPMNLISGTLVRDGESLAFAEATNNTDGFRLRLSPGQEKQLQAYATRSVILGARPEDLAIVGEERSNADLIEVAVDRVAHTGPDVYAHARTKAHTLSVRASTNANIKPGTNLWLEPEASAVHFFDPQTGLRLT